ncbi:hypothetical protein HID58_041083 [Brassica napus]|uniref:Uncharacterized protein n=2 Tax=Brassica TaxID=3705 RepID=A0A0D3A458_BRAOL|nr:PREDICTED: uncharacterized protein LOC106325192 isoform X3 [Brassica oleracea var. oleracea]XP_013728041.1 uncharacterized protein BNAC01G11070D isoform X3 [Brassica napus]KAH0901580.1 hypothetical protein HID58_041083 [Brassica napus]CAF2069680.1 unnamed protein product [Brassica napus]
MKLRRRELLVVKAGWIVSMVILLKVITFALCIKQSPFSSSNPLSLSLSLINSEEATTVYSEDAVEEEAHEETEEEAQEDETVIQDKNGRTSVHSSIRQQEHMRKDAMAGLHVLRLMPEPTAVALLYAQQ